MCKCTASNTRARVYPGHMVDDDVDYDLDTNCATSICHGLEFGATASFGFNLVRNNLIISPPLWASDVLRWGGDCSNEELNGRCSISQNRARTLNIAIASLGEEGAFGLHTLPVPCPQAGDGL
jgi:hypothetical protein